MLMQELDQCYYCLFKYPSSVKKAKSNRINEHNAEQVYMHGNKKLLYSGKLSREKNFAKR